MDDGEEHVSIGELLATLSAQKAELRRTLDAEAATTAKSLSSSPSSPSLKRRTKLSSSEPVLPLTKTSSLPNSASYSFGKPRHLKGKFRIPICEPRDIDFAETRSGTKVPGVGSYNHPVTDGREDQVYTDGLTGGWRWREHAVFLQTFQESGSEAGPEFFDLLLKRLPHVPCWVAADHVRWYAEKEKQESRKERRIVGWRQEHTMGSTNLSGDAEERSAEARRCRLLCQQATEAEQERGGRPPGATAVAQHRTDGQVLDSMLRGHPQFRKSPNYSFGASKELRDLTEKRHTTMAHVRASSHLDNPGPTDYVGFDEGCRLLRSSPKYSCKLKFAQVTGDKPSRVGPGYEGPTHAGVKAKKDLEMTQLTSPAWRFGKAGTEGARFQAAELTATPGGVGPGTYRC